MKRTKAKFEMRSRLRSVAATVLVFAFVILTNEVAIACPNCKGAVSENGLSGMAAGFAYSIGWMLLIPITLLSAWAVALRRLFRSAAFRR